MKTLIKWPWVSRHRYQNLKAENLELKKALFEARKNDNRDPVSGEYVSAKRGSFTCGG